MSDEINRKIDNYFEIRKILWTAIIILTGGVVTLTLHIDSFIKSFWIVLGFIAELIFVYSITKINENIEELLAKLEEN